MMIQEVTSRTLRLQAICRQRGWTVGLAESCTGGLLSSWICTEPGVSDFYMGGVVNYARSVKQGLLKVPQPVLAANGEVSLAVARAMARGVTKALQCTWSVSVTGVAGPGGGTPEKPVGFVCFAVVGPGFEEVASQQFAAQVGRQDIQRQAALFAFDFLLNAMR
jgi:PncC family amidohydrolase